MKKLFVLSLICSGWCVAINNPVTMAQTATEKTASQENDPFEQMILEQVKQFSPDMACAQKVIIDKMMRYKLDTIKDILMVDKDDAQLVNVFIGSSRGSIPELKGTIIGLQYSVEQMEKVTGEVVAYFREKAQSHDWEKEVINDLTENYYAIYFKNQIQLLKNKLVDLKLELETMQKALASK